MFSDEKFPIPPFEVKNSKSTFPCLFICEHASNYIPESYNQLGLDDRLLTEHIAWDLGAKELSEYLAEAFNCTAVLCQYSRLMIDCNRPTNVASSIIEISEKHTIPGNLNLSDKEKQQRVEHIFHPFHNKVKLQVDRLMEVHSTFPLIGIHSFTPEFKDSVRPWQFSVMWKQETPFVDAIIQHFKNHPLKDVIGFNKPYSAKTVPAYTTEYHADSNQLPNLIFEVRQDLLIDEAGINFWGTVIKKALSEVLVN